MNKSLLYYLGAGASVQALPLADGLPTCLSDLANALDEESRKRLSSDRDKAPLWGGARERLCEALRWLASEASRHATVDTFAKKLFFRGNRKDLKKLKSALSAYLLIEQARKPVDMRYDSFLATILSTDELHYQPHLPDKLRIITWNYDTQLEKAFYGFCEDRDHVLDSITFNDHIYRVNGHCGTSQAGHIGQLFDAVWKGTSDETWEAGIELYEECMSDVQSPDPDIRFAWEDPTQARLANTRLDLSDISAMVVIGYSFPYFNRTVDQYLFSLLPDSPLERIYLQYPDGHSSIEKRLRSLMLPGKVDIIPIPSEPKDPFYIPDELWQI